jgi:hypothetical protein
MRLTFRLLILVLLLVMAAFTMVITPVSQADACTDGCMNGYATCMGNGNPPDQQKCADDQRKCLAKCNPAPSEDEH